MVEIVKIGGNVIDDPERLRSFLKKFASLEGRKILVHGGGKEATRISKTLGIETRMIDGRRITDKDTIDVVTMVYAGLINKRVVALLQEYGCDAIGLTGADGNAIEATRRSPEPIDYGFVGDIDPADVDVKFINSLLDSGKTPVFCAICHDGKGTLLNCNADTIASSLAVGMSREDTVRLTYCFEMAGVMADINNEESVIPVIDESNYKELVSQGILTGGMLPKIQNALKAVKEGVSQVKICRDSDLGSSKGTVIQ